jgi:hypothetical protein
MCIFTPYNLKIWSRDSAVGIGTGYGLDDRGVDVLSPGWVKIYLLSAATRLALGSIQPPIQWVLGVNSSGVKPLEREADHSAPTNAEVKKIWSYTPIPPYIFMV